MVHLNCIMLDNGEPNWGDNNPMEDFEDSKMNAKSKKKEDTGCRIVNVREINQAILNPSRQLTN